MRCSLNVTPELTKRWLESGAQGEVAELWGLCPLPLEWVNLIIIGMSQLLREGIAYETGSLLLSWALGYLFFLFYLLPRDNALGAHWTDVKQIL